MAGQGRVRAIFSAVAVAGAAFVVPTAVADSFSIPRVVDFEDPAYAAFYDFIASRIGGHPAEGGFKVVTSEEAGSCRIVDGSVGGPADVHATHADVTARFLGAEDSTLMHGAGIGIRYADDPMRFLALLVGGNGYTLLAFDDGAVTQRVAGTVPDGPTDAPVRIGARESGGGAEFFVNGSAVGTLSDSHVDGWAVALLHCGPGSYTFDNWGLSSTGDAGLGD